MKARSRRVDASIRALSLLLSLAAVGSSALAADPFASNNGLYPPASAWQGPFRSLSYNYPSGEDNGWRRVAPREPLSIANAEAYVNTLKTYLAPSMRGMIETPNDWDPAKNRWFDMPWMGPGQSTGTGIDPMSGREAILGAFSGQTLLQETFAGSGLTVDMQNHTVIYYDSMAAEMLGRLWANPFSPDRSGVSFPEGAMVVKAAGVTPTPEQWPILEGSTVWKVFRPAVEGTRGPTHDPKSDAGKARVLDLRVLQFDIIVKDSLASPQTGWVFTTFVYDKDAPGGGTWDKLVPLGAMWGNDPKFANEPGGTDPNGGPLQETWINPAAPQYAKATLGWGGRLSGPIDVAERHNVLLTNGQNVPVQRASSCLSCHGTAQFPFVANLYPSPNKTFPPEGQTFPMYVPGSDMWARWFQNRAGSVPQNPNKGAVALDYDMLIMFALSAFDAAAGNDVYVQDHADVH
jgi:hypothetical protein